jgi:vacuolar-type H+-ATPase subunit F/Vma7
MSTPLLYIGDEVTAAGFRLAGVPVRVPGRQAPAEVLRRALDEADLILISAETAQRIPPAERDGLLSSISPAVVVLPDLRGTATMPDVDTRVRRQLGVLE